MRKQALRVPRPPSSGLPQVVGEFMSDVKRDKNFNDLVTAVQEAKANLERFIEPGKSRLLSPRNQLVVLRKWNSYTPILPAEKDEVQRKGGGYFIRVGQTGIVVDPGFNFVEHFLRAGFKLDDIDHILVSHAHNDHTVELEGIFSLLYRRNRKSVRPKRVKLYLNLGAFKKFAGYFDLANPRRKDYIERIVMLNECQLVQVDEGIQLLTSRVKHHEMITKKYALGFTLCITAGSQPRKVLNFTCDTGWDDSVTEVNKRVADDNHIDKTDILIAHMGTVDPRELEFDANKTFLQNKKCLNDHHLGLAGTVAAIHFWQPELVLLSEFGEEMCWVRHELAAGLAKKMQRAVLATDLNFRVDLDTLRVFSFNKRSFCCPSRMETLCDKDGQLYFIDTDGLRSSERKALPSSLGTKISPWEKQPAGR